jgi:FAD/FMN-containing dehydrogenase/Fe-S oxidoreductase
MPRTDPHISLPPGKLIPRVLGIPQETFAPWPEAVVELAGTIAGELFLIRYNPFIETDLVRDSVHALFSRERIALAEEYSEPLAQGISRFWAEYEADQQFREELLGRLKKVLPEDSIVNRPNALVEFATDATDLRMELPLLVVTPHTTEQVRAVLRLANETYFAVIPRGGGSGLTGGAIPSGRRTVVLSMARFKGITDISEETMTLRAQAGVITLDAILAAAKQGLLFTVDPASKSASSLGGNVAENSGGPFAFEYGTTLDNILGYTMVTPSAEIIEVRRRDHPRHKILPEEIAVFDVLDESGTLLETISLSGDQIRSQGLGKDVTNKHLGGLPGVQKEGVDGIVTEAVFTLYPKPSLSRTLCLEFFGRSMHKAMLVIKDIVALRDTIREQGDLVKISALEEFGSKYVKAIEYKKKSSKYEGDPISVLIVELDSDDEQALDDAAASILDIATAYSDVDVFAAKNDKEAEFFWEDRHKLSAIAKRTSGFKINEDVVIPLDAIPVFSDFLERLNLVYMAKAYRTGLQEAGRLPGMGVDDKFINLEFSFTSRVLKGSVGPDEVSDQELEIQVFYFFRDLKNRYPQLVEKLDAIHGRLTARRIIIANHMHAGDGNCHVNIPVDSNDPEMLRLTEGAVEQIFAKVQELRGEVSGEHGIGITKIDFLSEEKMQALKEYKQRVDPSNILNPGKLTSREQPVAPFTFSFNRLIQDMRLTGLPDKERLITMLQEIQTCTRCGKCKHVCPMFYPQQGLLFHPRNKNISLGAIIEAAYYAQIRRGAPDKKLLGYLREIMEHCTACGRCTAVCPLKINSAGVALHLRAYVEDKGAGGHPFKTRILNVLAKDPSKRAPLAAKFATIGQSIQNKVGGVLPMAWKRRFDSPLFSGPGPELNYENLTEVLALDKGSVFIPKTAPENISELETVFYFPGCGAGLFYRTIAMAGLAMLLKSGVAVAMPGAHLCCGYPLLAAGCEDAFLTNRDRNNKAIGALFKHSGEQGLAPTTVLTSCGTCREGMEKHELYFSPKTGEPGRMDVVQFLMERLILPESGDQRLLYHQSCHAEWTGQDPAKAGEAYRGSLARITGAKVAMSPGCCAESGMGAMTSPAIYNKLRERKQLQLTQDLADYPDEAPIIVGCPSCKIGISRSMLQMKRPQKVMHTLEYLAVKHFGPDWEKNFRQAVAASIPSGKGKTAVRRVALLKELE